ncbi:MAG TPA: 2-hydroxychromene-2-carboxylate isomerase [Stellaceae bacterium]|nr:2-hydroxychromene-2-carboxylate isomerase [Stellaceae bacterium]
MDEASGNGATLEFWYDFASPYSYLAAGRIEGLAAGKMLAILWRPFLLGPIFRMRPHDPSPFQNPSPAERRYRWRDVQRLCAAAGLPLRLPSVYPRNGLLAARIALIAVEEGWGPAFTRAAFHANFAEDRDIAAPAVIGALAAALGRDPAALLERAQSPGNKERLRGRIEAAMGRGIFGAPSFLVGEELFWGNDRLEQATAWALAPPDLPPLSGE